MLRPVMIANQTLSKLQYGAGKGSKYSYKGRTGESAQYSGGAEGKEGGGGEGRGGEGRGRGGAAVRASNIPG